MDRTKYLEKKTCYYGKKTQAQAEEAANAIQSSQRKKLKQQVVEFGAFVGGFLGIGGDDKEDSAVVATGKIAKVALAEAWDETAKFNYNTMVATHVYSLNLPLMANMGADTLTANNSAESVGALAGNLLTGTQGGPKADIAKEMGKGLIAKSLNMGGGGGTALKLATGHVENPFSFTVFKDVAHRSFSFTWNFVPKSHEESNALYDIIDILKANMLPTNKKTLLGVPNEFKIQYWHMVPESVSNFTGKVTYGQKENPYYPETNYCYLTSLTHTPNEQGDNLHPDGAPASHQLILAFNELRPLDRQSFRDKLNAGKKNERDGTPPEGEDASIADLASGAKAVGKGLLDKAKDFYRILI